MRTIVISVIVFSMLVACNNGKQGGELFYPETKKVDTVDTYFGTEVPDPYRWLEDDNSAETKAWVKAQNKVSFDYLKSLPERKDVKKRLTELWNYPKQSVPMKKAGLYFYKRNNGLQNQDVLSVKDGEGRERMLVDPNALSKDGTISISNYKVSKDGKFLAYMLSDAGSDWNTIYIVDVGTGKKTDDEIRWVKFSDITWYKDGFFYSRYDAPTDGNALTSKNEYHKIYYHKLGGRQDDDELVFVDEKNPLRNCYVNLTQDEKFLIVYQSETTSGNIVYIRDLSKDDHFTKFNNDFSSEWWVVGHVDGQLYIHTNYKAPKRRLVKVGVNQLSYTRVKTVIPEGKDLLYSVNYIGGKMFGSYLKDAKSEIKIFDIGGKNLGEIELPALGTSSDIVGSYNDSEAYFEFESYTLPKTVYRYDVRSNTYTEYFKPTIDFDFNDYETKQVFYRSKDGTIVPMFIVHKKGVVLDGNNPTLLYGYGGFDISLTPDFRVRRLAWLEKGGVYAEANLRGGGEYGEFWHESGTKMKKQNVFDDFIAAAEYLIEEKYTSSEKLAIQGGSNGGLLIGAVVNQRPDLFAAAIPQVGVMDMLRFQKFTIGWAWVGDYGSSSDSEEMFKYLYGYSPLHNIRNDVDYPAIMVMTADHDDRVVPAHSFKYAAQLQAQQKGRKNPRVIRIQTNAGHGAGRSTSVAIEEYTDIWAFLLHNLNAK